VGIPRGRNTRSGVLPNPGKDTKDQEKYFREGEKAGVGNSKTLIVGLDPYAFIHLR